MERPNSKFTVSGYKLLHVLHDLDGNAYPLFLVKLRYFSSPSLYAIRPGQYFDRALAPIDSISVWFCADDFFAQMHNYHHTRSVYPMAFPDRITVEDHTVILFANE